MASLLTLTRSSPDSGVAGLIDEVVDAKKPTATGVSSEQDDESSSTGGERPNNSSMARLFVVRHSERVDEVHENNLSQKWK